MSSKVPNAIDLHVGSRMRMLRVTKGLSQSSLGESLGITFQQIQKYEKGTNRIGASRLQAIADVLGAPISFFFEDQRRDDVEVPALASPPFYFSATKEAAVLNEAFSRIEDAGVRRKVISLVRALADVKSAGVPLDDGDLKPSA